VTNPKHNGVKCGGVFVNVTKRNVFKPVKMAGTPKLRLAIVTGVPPEKIVEIWKDEVEKFKKNYLLYENFYNVFI
jgi:hypothetical protein